MFEKISVSISNHSSRDLLSCVDNAMVLSEGKIVARGTPQELIKILELLKHILVKDFE